MATSLWLTGSYKGRIWRSETLVSLNSVSNRPGAFVPNGGISRTFDPRPSTHMLKLPGHSRYAYSPIVDRPDYTWPGVKRLAFYVALKIGHFAFCAGLGADPSNS